MSNNTPPFDDICTLFDLVAKSKSSERGKLFQTFFKKYQSNYSPSVFEPLRLILPALDTERKYNLKEDRLATVLIKALGLDPQSDDAKRLKQYKVPHSFNPTPGDFIQNAFEVIKKRSTVHTSQRSIRDANDYLDKLATSNIDQVELFKEIASQFTAVQVTCLLRIILKDTKLHVGENTVLNAIYPKASDLYTNHKNLRDIADPAYYLSNGSSMKAFNMFTPQRAEKYSKKLFDLLPKPVYCEEKIDGNRILLHYDRDQDRFLWHTRNRFDETNAYGATSKDTTKLSGHIYRGIKPKQVILDGEMIEYDPTLNKYKEFGQLRTSTSYDINDPTTSHPCYVVFDILMVDNLSLIDYSLEERNSALRKLVQDQGTFMRLLERKELETEQQVMQELEERYRNQEEGIMLKSKTDKYEVGKKSKKWLKLKPEYVDELSMDLDLLVVGARYGDGRRGGKLASIMCAVRDDRIPDTDPPRFVTFTLAGTGLADKNMQELSYLMKNLVDYDPKRTPDWLVHPTRGGETFDKLFGYQESVVIQVKGSQIVNSTKFGMECTLRFPRFLSIRPDKGWQDVESYSNIIKLRSEVGTKRKSEELNRVKRKIRRGGQLMHSQKGLDPSNIQQTSNILAGKVFHVINGTKIDPNEPVGLDKDYYDRIIKENGGEYVQTHKTADILIAGVNNTTVKSIISAHKNLDIIHPNYITDCIEAKKLLPITPKYMFYTSPQTQEAFSQTMDKYGDPYGKKIMTKDLTEIMQRMSENDADFDYRALAKTVSERYFPEGMSGMIFLNCVAYFDMDTSHTLNEPITSAWVSWKRCQEEMMMARSVFELEGGEVCSQLNDTVTHVVLNKHDLDRFQTYIDMTVHNERKPRFVVLDWIKACYDQETLLDEKSYNPKNYMKAIPE